MLFVYHAIVYSCSKRAVSWVFGIFKIFRVLTFFGFFGSSQTSLLCIMGELAGGWSVAVALGVSDRWQVACNTWHVTHETWQITHKTGHMPHEQLHMTHDIWHLTHETFFCCPFFSFCFGINASVRKHNFSKKKFYIHNGTCGPKLYRAPHWRLKKSK